MLSKLLAGIKIMNGSYMQVFNNKRLIYDVLMFFSESKPNIPVRNSYKHLPTSKESPKRSLDLLANCDRVVVLSEMVGALKSISPA